MSLDPLTVRLPIGDEGPTARLYYGQDVRTSLRALPEASVHMVATSPPFWALRDYGVEPQDWPEVTYRPMAGLPKVTVPAQTVALGLEPNPQHYVGHLVLVFRELSRVLRKDGVAWLNLGGSYVSTSGFMGQIKSAKTFDQVKSDNAQEDGGMGFVGVRKHQETGLPVKNLVLTPHQVAMALQTEGWRVRNDIVWVKGAGMAEPVQDRSSRNHEHVFLMAQNRHYHFDLAAGEPMVKRTVWNVPPQPYPGAHFATWPPALVEPMILSGCPEGGTVLDPFSGSGTTGQVALSHGRNYIGLDLQADYLALAEARIQGEPAPQVSGDDDEGTVLDLFGTDDVYV